MKSVINALVDVPEALQGEYEEKSGKFYLKLEDIPSGLVKQEDLQQANQKVVEFRDKNIALLKENDELRPLKLKYEGIDPEEAKKAMKRIQDLDKGGIKDISDVNDKVKAAAEELVKPLRDQLALMAAESANERKRADEFLLQSKIGDAFVKAGGKASATDFVVNLAKNVFEVKDSSVNPKTGNFSKSKPGDPITIDEWLTSVVQKDHDYVFTPSNGGGATHGQKSNGTIKPTAKVGQTLLTNPTPQQLGEHASDIASGKMKIVYETAAQ